MNNGEGTNLGVVGVAGKVVVDEVVVVVEGGGMEALTNAVGAVFFEGGKIFTIIIFVRRTVADEKAMGLKKSGEALEGELFTADEVKTADVIDDLAVETEKDGGNDNVAVRISEKFFANVRRLLRVHKTEPGLAMERCEFR